MRGSYTTENHCEGKRKKGEDKERGRRCSLERRRMKGKVEGGKEESRSAGGNATVALLLLY